MTEAEYQQKAREFIAQLEHWPKVGKRPFGYPKFAWWMQAVWIILGFLLLIPISVGEAFNRGSVLAALCGMALIGFAFTMRVVAFTSAASGAVDRWTILRLLELEKHVGYTPPTNEAKTDG